ncbi:MAG: M20/M25/M40 family metallo-hydrolase, partial [Oscillospiraceae bacterium]|nr:M20/M25/M40 family metallo-hydrolase [Oscillospiraceae bacterium]
DTLGMVIRTIDPNGMIRVRQLGGVNFSSYEGETVTIHTREGKEYTGLMTCQSHSVHAFDDARTLPRDENTMMIILDEKVSSKEDVKALGIRHGDFISVEPRCQVTENGYIKSRFIDDKGAIACVFAMLKYLTENNLKPKYKTILAFPYSEEIGFGGTYVPPEVSEYVAIDIGLIGPDYDGNEYAVSICGKDAAAPYDFELTNRLIGYAEKAGCDYEVDVYYHYGTDANAAVRAGNNLRAATFGMAVWCSHGMERTHISGLLNTTNLLLGYVLDI